MAERLRFVDIVKGICIILVVVGHYLPEAAPNTYKNIVSFIYTFHMPVFMCMSGFLFFKGYKREQPRLTFIGKKLKRLIIPYLCISLIIVTIKLIAGYFITLDNPVNPLSFLRIFLYPDAAFFLWFIYTLFIIFMIVPLFMKLKQGLFILSAFALILFFLPDAWFPSIFCLNMVKKMFVYFVIGCLIYKYRSNIPTSLSTMLLLTAVHFICFYYHANTAVLQQGVLDHGMQLIMGLIGCINLVILGRLFDGMKLSNVLYQLGIFSSAIYLFHTMSMAPVKWIWLKFIGIDNMYTFLLSILIICAAGIIIPIIIKKILNKSRRLSALLLGE